MNSTEGFTTTAANLAHEISTGRTHLSGSDVPSESAAALILELCKVQANGPRPGDPLGSGVADLFVFVIDFLGNSKSMSVLGAAIKLKEAQGRAHVSTLRDASGAVWVHLRRPDPLQATRDAVRRACDRAEAAEECGSY